MPRANEKCPVSLKEMAIFKRSQGDPRLANAIQKRLHLLINMK